MCKAFGQQVERLVPRNGIEYAVAAFGAGAANHRVLQLRLGILLHDARAALGTKHALVHDVVFIALNEAHVRFAVALLRRYLDPAATGAHVAGGVMRLLLAAILKLNGSLGSGGERRIGRERAWRQSGGTGAVAAMGATDAMGG